MTNVYIHYEVHNVYVYCDNKTINIFNNYNYSLVLCFTRLKKNFKMLCHWKRLWFYNMMKLFVFRKIECNSYFFSCS